MARHKGKYCYNCQAGLHGKCSMPWCICPLKECQIGYHKVSPMEVAISYFITKQTRSNISENIEDKTKVSE
jgi:hypothetical protein